MSLTVTFRDREFPLAATLRVAYNLQGQHNHKSYIDIFQSIDKMTLEEQIGIVWAAFAAANRDEATFIKSTDFREDLLDRYNVGELMEMVGEIIGGIMGKDPEELKADGMAELEKQEEQEEAAENFPLEPGMESLE